MWAITSFRLYISVALQQKTANFKVANGSRVMQCGIFTIGQLQRSVLTERKQKNKLAA